MHHRLLIIIATFVAAGLALSPLAACSSETTSNAKDTVKSAKEDVAKTADEAAARAAAEALRVSLKGNKTADKEGIRSVKAIDQAAKDLPGDATYTGVTDANGDGLDDDGQVQVTVSQGNACLTLPAQGENTTVKGGAC